MTSQQSGHNSSTFQTSVHVQRKFHISQSISLCSWEPPPNLQLYIINLQHNATLKGRYQGQNLIEFYKCLILSDEHAQVKSDARGFISVFGGIYMCANMFSEMEYMKSNGFYSWEALTRKCSAKCFPPPPIFLFFSLLDLYYE